MHPSAIWDEIVKITTALYEEALPTRLGTEKFKMDGRHVGTGGGNHVVIGGATPADSPFLRRPDLRSLVGYWLNHPSLSFLFRRGFIGPTSQHPRVDEGRNDCCMSSNWPFLLGFRLTIRARASTSPPMACRPLFRNLLID